MKKIKSKTVSVVLYSCLHLLTILCQALPKKHYSKDEFVMLATSSSIQSLTLIRFNDDILKALTNEII